MFTWGGVVILATLESLGRYRDAFKVVLMSGVVHLLFILLSARGTNASQEKGLDMETLISQSVEEMVYIHGPQSCSALAENGNLMISGRVPGLTSNECCAWVGGCCRPGACKRTSK